MPDVLSQSAVHADPARPADVLFIVNSLRHGGAEKHVVTLLNTFETDRIRPSLAYLKAADPLLSQLKTEKVAAIVSCDAGRRIDFGCVRRLAQLIAERNIRAVVCTNTYSSVYGYLAKLRSGRSPKLISVYHTTILPTRKEKLGLLLYRWMLRRFDLLIYVCNSQREYWRARGLRARRDEVIHNGIDVAYFTDRYSPEEKLAFRQRAGFAADDYVIGLCAALRPEKAHGDLLEAIARMRSEGVRAKALLIGDGPERARIEQKIRDLALEEHVYITGLQSDVRPWIACADVMTLVSRAIETFSIAALESMALGKPLVMSDIGGAAEQVTPGQNGVLFAPGDVSSLRNHLTTLASGPLRITMGAAAAERVRRDYRVERMSAAFENAIAELAAFHGAPGRTRAPERVIASSS
jgi:glycosyltransferase involved in cell wall biosynthesis